MAIDDNASYKLTGAQVKDLANRINNKAEETDLSVAGSYSTSEAATPYTWIDGSTIYRKTIAVSSPASREVTISHGISNFDVCVKADGIITNNLDGYQPITRVLPSLMAGWGCGVGDVTSSSFKLFIGTNYVLANIDAWVTLWYTKTS